MTISIRTIETKDIERIAEIHCKSFNNSFFTKIGLQVVKKYYSFLINEQVEKYSIVADDESNIIGFCFSGEFEGSTIKFIKKNYLYLFFKTIAKPAVFFNKDSIKKIIEGISLLFGKTKKKSENSKGEEILFTSCPFRILAIAVEPECQGKGVADLLMNACERIAFQKGFKKIGLTVRNDNFRAIRFYEKRGYIKVENTQNEEYLRMEKICEEVNM